MAKKKIGKKAAGLNDKIRLRLSTEEKEAFTKAAALEGRDLSNWLRYVAKQAAEKVGMVVP